MTLEETLLKSASAVGSGEVRRFTLPDGKISITRITTFCPDVVGPGPVHAYLVESDALVLLDTGLPTHIAKSFFYHWRAQPMPREVEELPADHSETELRDGFRLAERSLSDIDMLVISHGHADHFLMARSILDGHQILIAAHIFDTPAICNPWGLLNMWILRQDQMRGSGMPEPWSAQESARDQLREGMDPVSLGMALGIDQPVLRSGPLRVNRTPVKSVEIRSLPGHSPGSIGLLVGEGKDKVLLCGDVLMHPISPHPDDLLVYLRTLEDLGARDDIVLALPAHGDAIRDPAARIRALREHHQRRLKVTYETCAQPRCVWDVATLEGYFDTYVDPKKFNLLAGLEVLVHMELLHMVDGLRRVPAKGGVQYFVNSAESFEEVYGRIRELVTDSRSGAMMRY
ncbi:MAG: MBL fold metallo-hydrolase [Deltaproteobacteria bacterium]|nr:MBL fold metallo-hydrolase [Deltaproteobacteria bacterium]